jgi:hypothetical protein
MNRRPIQIEIGQRQDDNDEPIQGDRLYVLCDDGTIWYNDLGEGWGNEEWKWWVVPAVPQGEREDLDLSTEHDE